MRPFQYTPYLIPILLSAITATIVATIAWRRRSASGAVSLAAMMLAVVVWSLGYAFRLSSVELVDKYFWSRFHYLGIVTAGPAWFVFVMQYTGRDRWLSRRILTFIVVEIVLVLALIWTNHYHNLFWTVYGVKTFGASLVVWWSRLGPAFWVHCLYNYALLLFTLHLLVRSLVDTPRLYRGQVGMLLVALLIILAGNVLTLLELPLYAPLDLTPLALCLGGVIVAWALFRGRLLDLLPVAYEAVLEGISEGVLVLDVNHRVVSMNPAAARILNCRDAAFAGSMAAEVLAPWPQLLDECGHAQRSQAEITRSCNGRERYYDVQVAPLYYRAKEPMGWSVVFHEVTERKLTEHSLVGQKQLYQNLVTVALATTESHTLEETLKNILNIAATLSEAEGGSLIVLDESGDVTLGMVAFESRGPIGGEKAFDRVMEKGLAGWVAGHRRPALVRDTERDERWFPLPNARFVTRSALALPIGKEWLQGILTLTHSQANHFEDEHLTLMEAAAEQMALALRNARIYEEQRRLAERLSVLYEVLKTLGGNLNPKTVPQVAVEVISRLTQWSMVAILLPDTENEYLVTHATNSSSAVSHGWHTSMREGICGRAFQSHQPQYASDILDHDDSALNSELQVRSQLAIPLLRAQRAFGVLHIGSKHPDAFDLHEQMLAEMLGEAVALTLDVARSHAKVGSYVADLSALYTVSHAISQSLILNELLTETLQATLSSLSADAGLINLFDEDQEQLQTFAHEGLPGELMALLQQCGMGGTPCVHVYEQATPIIIDDVEHDSPALEKVLETEPGFVERMRALGMRSYAGVPLLYQGRPIGTLTLFFRPPRESSTHALALQMAIGRQIATAVTNARLFQAVEDERGRLQALIETSRDGIIFINTEQRVMVVNAQALEFLHFGGTPETWQNRLLLDGLLNLRRRFPEAARSIVTELNQLKDVPNTPGKGEITLPPRTLCWSYMPVMSDGATLGWLVILRDVTEERLLEKMRNDITDTMVHDLRNPLTSISGYMKLLQRSLSQFALTPTHVSMLSMVEQSSERMLKLVNAILDIGRLESGRMPLRREAVVMNELICQVIEAQRSLAIEKNLSLECALPPESPIAWADAMLIERVLQNLIDNAIKFTPEEGLVRVSMHCENGTSERYVISVQDSGDGVPPEVRPRIFEKFVTGDQVGRGSGLGLAFCRMVIEAHGERLWLSNSTKEGATFSFTLSSSPSD